MAKLKSCGVILFRQEPQLSFLLMQHPDRWDLPKGHVDPGETELQCALRELEEETGYFANEVRLDPDFRFQLDYSVRYKRSGNQWQTKSLIMFLGELLVDRPPLLTEHEGYAWWTWEPPHRIQEKTIDPLLASVASHWQTKSGD
ncbi:bis(5'-nucleosyl)-tetraphosphatase [Lignipirellula cremea]|uniref:Bis(5'-nucleosyl)-tetraphosphatase [asymmetrical] n=1 Tax=Lignipirellula cremea TaxID=2528010 RepID=A0A518DQY6_9BACT|nr:NUDIX domain-containing protein [Lignipirellula cremea]QDU94256.1 RNA pyrophosphohydrolase [Lignipirellula cremea]